MRPLERAEKIATHTESVVHHHAYTLLLSKLCYRFIVRNIECRVAKILEIYGLCAAVDERLEVLNLVTLCKAHLDAHVAEGDCKHGECSAIEERLSHDVVAGAADVGNREEYSRLA